MPREESVVSMKHYGKINLKLKEMIDSRNMTRNSLARAVNTRFEVIDKWYLNKVEKIDADVLARICFALKCQVSDIIEYVPEEHA